MVRFRVRFENGNVPIFREFFLWAPRPRKGNTSCLSTAWVRFRLFPSTVWTGWQYGLDWFRVRFCYPLRWKRIREPHAKQYSDSTLKNLEIGTNVFSWNVGGNLVDLLMGLFRGAVFHHGRGAWKQPIKQPTEMPTSTMALVGRFPSLMGRFPTLMGRFADFLLRGRFTSWKYTGKQPIKKRGVKRFLKTHRFGEDRRTLCSNHQFRDSLQECYRPQLDDTHLEIVLEWIFLIIALTLTLPNWFGIRFPGVTMSGAIALAISQLHSHFWIVSKLIAWWLHLHLHFTQKRASDPRPPHTR